MKKGFIYILSNDSLKDNLFKIGKTSKETIERSKQLSSSTSIPENFKIEAEFEFSDINWAEREIHDKLSEFRYNRKKEFFKCDFNIAKQIILEIQILDKQNEILSLKSELGKTNKLLNNPEFVKPQWNSFFNKLKWDFTEVNREENYLLPDFIIDTNGLDFGPRGEIETFFQKANIYIIPGFQQRQVETNTLNLLQEIIEQSTNENRLIIIAEKPIEEMVEIIFGWEYDFENKDWVERKFIESENKFGLFDEDRTWFDFINGKPVKRDGLYPSKDEIMKIWNK